MQRNKKKKKMYKQTGGGTFHLKTGKIIKPQEEFPAYPHEIPDAFRDTIVCLEEEDDDEDEGFESVSEYALEPVDEPEKKEEGEDEYELKHKSAGWYDVIEVHSGKALNDKSLREEEAKELLKKLEE